MNEPLLEVYNYPLDRELSENRPMMFGFDCFVGKGNIEYEQKRNRYRQRIGFAPNYGLEYNIWICQIVVFYRMFTFRLRLNKVGEVLPLLCPKHILELKPDEKCLLDSKHCEKCK